MSDHICNQDDVRRYDVYNADKTEKIGQDVSYHCSICRMFQRGERV